MKKMFILLIALSSGALYGVCACQLNRPKPQPKPQVAQVIKAEDKQATAAPAQSKPQEEKTADKK
jgi:hypothetical protein